MVFLGGLRPPDPPAGRGLRPRTPAMPGAAPPDPCDAGVRGRSPRFRRGGLGGRSPPSKTFEKLYLFKKYIFAKKIKFSQKS